MIPFLFLFFGMGTSLLDCFHNCILKQVTCLVSQVHS
jgi:hypothetical protein